MGVLLAVQIHHHTGTLWNFTIGTIGVLITTNPTDLQVTASPQWTLMTFEDILAIALLSVSIICLLSKYSCGLTVAAHVIDLLML